MFNRIAAFLLTVTQAIFFPFASLLTVGRLSTAPWDCVPDSHYAGAQRLCDPQAAPQAQALMDRLQAAYGKVILSGQYVSPYEDYTLPRFQNEAGQLDVRLTNELVALQKVNGGKLPAVLGLDFTGCEFPDEWRDWVTQFALQWHALGGIVTFCWHFGVPKDIGSDPAGWARWDSAIYAKDTNFSLSAALADKNSAAYQYLLHGIHAVSVQLRRLQEAGVPVLWRPLHEAAGGWFWWGGEGRDAYLGLYNLIYEQMTGPEGLHNLIWVWNAQDNGWYPGDGRADILADDPYPIANLTWLYPIDPGRSVRFKYTRRASPNKMVACAENDTLPRLDFMWNQNTKWLFFCTWDREKLLKPDPDHPPYGVLPEFSGVYDRAQTVYGVYHDPRVAVLEEIGGG